MPAYADALPEPADRWALVLYVRSLRAPRALLDWLFDATTDW